MASTIYKLGVIVVFISGLSTVASIKCVVCGPICPYSELLPEPIDCDRFHKNYTHCKKVVIKIGHVAGSERICSHAPDSEQGNKWCYGVQEAICHYFCDKDGCNASPATLTPHNQWDIFVGILLLILNTRGII